MKNSALSMPDVGNGECINDDVPLFPLFISGAAQKSTSEGGVGGVE